jgi:hypothetical protein
MVDVQASATTDDLAGQTPDRPALVAADSSVTVVPLTPLIRAKGDAIVSPWYFSWGLLGLILFALVIAIIALIIAIIALMKTSNRKPAMTRIHDTTQLINSYTTGTATVFFNTSTLDVGSAGGASKNITYDGSSVPADEGQFTIHYTGLYHIHFTTAVDGPTAAGPPIAAWVRVTPSGLSPSGEEPFAGYTAQLSHGTGALAQQQPLSLDTVLYLEDGDRIEIRATVLNASLTNTPLSIGQSPTPFDGAVVTEMSIVWLSRGSGSVQGVNSNELQVTAEDTVVVDGQTEAVADTVNDASTYTTLSTDAAASLDTTTSGLNVVPSQPTTTAIRVPSSVSGLGTRQPIHRGGYPRRILRGVPTSSIAPATVPVGSSSSEPSYVNNGSNLQSSNATSSSDAPPSGNTGPSASTVDVSAAVSGSAGASSSTVDTSAPASGSSGAPASTVDASVPATDATITAPISSTSLSKALRPISRRRRHRS